MKIRAHGTLLAHMGGVHGPCELDTLRQGFTAKSIFSHACVLEL